MDQNPYEALQSVPAISRQGFIAPSVALPIAIAVVLILVNFQAFAVALACALNDYPWELSLPNLCFSLISGAVCGIPAALIAASAYFYTHHLLVPATLLAAWPLATGVCFYFVISIYGLA